MMKKKERQETYNSQLMFSFSIKSNEQFLEQIQQKLYVIEVLEKKTYMMDFKQPCLLFSYYIY